VPHTNERCIRQENAIFVPKTRAYIDIRESSKLGFTGRDDCFNAKNALFRVAFRADFAVIPNTVITSPIAFFSSKPDAFIIRQIAFIFADVGRFRLSAHLQCVWAGGRLQKPGNFRQRRRSGSFKAFAGLGQR
jgi:hypothetical protein